MTVNPIGGIERRKIHLLDRVDHKLRQMIRRKPIPHVRRKQKSLLTPTLNEVLRHTGIVLNSADGPPLRNSLRPQQERGAGHPALPQCLTDQRSTVPGPRLALP